VRSTVWREVSSAVLVTLMGLALVAGTLVNKHRLQAKRDRLHATGVAVTASIAETRSSKGMHMRLVYDEGGKRYSSWIRCGTRRCAGGSGHTVSIWTDREDPSEFVAANGHTDNDIDPLDNWGVLGLGVVLAIVGGLSITVMWPNPRRRRRGVTVHAG